MYYMIEDLSAFSCRYLPGELNPLNDLALDLRWTWNHGSDQLWRSIDPDSWEITRNPWWILQSISQERLTQVIGDPGFRQELKGVIDARRHYLETPGWYDKKYPDKQKQINTIAYFSMEFGLGEAIPLYAGGLGILAGDYLKTASDLNLPVIGIGLLYQHGYFRQILTADGMQISANPPNDPTTLPMRPVTDANGGWLRVPLELPGRLLLLRAWKVQVGRTTLYLLDSNDPMNDAADRSIASKLYDDQPEFRLMQEIVLGIGGCKLLNLLGIHPEIYHINEGHAAFMVLERAKKYMQETGVNFQVALWATRAGNVFTTHTAVAAGFDIYSPNLLQRYFKEYSDSLGISLSELLSLGRQNPYDSKEAFNMAVLALHGSSFVNGVSQLHRDVSRQLFQVVFPRWPRLEVPVGYITNGVHMPSWDSQRADELWTNNIGKACWRQSFDRIPTDLQKLVEEEIWDLRKSARQELVLNVRRRLERQFRQHAADSSVIQESQKVLDPAILTLGFARRFATYKRPNLLLHNKERLTRLLTNPEHPIQLVIAGKAHPQDEEGKNLVREMVKFSFQPEVKNRMVFLPDYDIELAEELVQGIDLWINTPRRPWEACGTSGMKVIVNGGLNLSELDGWWAEAYRPDLGWAIGDRQEHGPDWDGKEAEQLYQLLENEIIPEYYDRNEEDIPLNWVRRIKSNMCSLAVEFSSNRMLQQYFEKVYLPAAERYQQRNARMGQLAKELDAWQKSLSRSWITIRFGKSRVEKQGNQWRIECEVFTGQLKPEAIEVEVYADPYDGTAPFRQTLNVIKSTSPTEGDYLYGGSVPSSRPIEHYSLRIIPAHNAAVIPLEDNHILWKYPV